MKEFSHCTVEMERGRRFLMSQNTALQRERGGALTAVKETEGEGTHLPRLTSCFINLMRASLGQHFLLL